MSDAEGRWALPLSTFERRTDRRAAYRIAELARRENVELLVIGEPLAQDGTVGEAARRVRRFGERVGKASGLPIRWVDETLTTVEAAERLAAAGADQRGHEARRDAVAAQILLQEALDQAPDGDTRGWNNPETGAFGTIQPLNSYEAGGSNCRRTEIFNSAKGTSGTSRFDFCKQPDGKWKVAPRRPAAAPAGKE